MFVSWACAVCILPALGLRRAAGELTGVQLGGDARRRAAANERDLPELVVADTAELPLFRRSITLRALA